MEDVAAQNIPEVGNPIELLLEWRADAKEREVHDSTGACLATCDTHGLPSARIVLIKLVDTRGLVFYTNSLSRKGSEIARNPRAALVFHWPTLQRQVRVEGAVEQVDGDEADAYFASRPRGSQIGAWASAQSSVLKGGLEELASSFRDAIQRHTQADVPRPSYWQGYRVVPERIEFWRHRDDRMHERLRYRRDRGGWIRERLAP